LEADVMRIVAAQTMCRLMCCRALAPSICVYMSLVWQTIWLICTGMLAFAFSLSCKQQTYSPWGLFIWLPS